MAELLEHEKLAQVQNYAQANDIPSRAVPPRSGLNILTPSRTEPALGATGGKAYGLAAAAKPTAASRSTITRPPGEGRGKGRRRASAHPAIALHHRDLTGGQDVLGEAGGRVAQGGRVHQVVAELTLAAGGGLASAGLGGGGLAVMLPVSVFGVTVNISV